MRQSLALRAHVLGGLVATALTALLLHTWKHPGEPVPPSLSSTRFAVAVLAGPQQAAQEAPRDADRVTESVAATPNAKVDQVVTAERPTSLPEAVEAAQDSAPGSDTADKEEVIPPARVSMPGGRLVAEDQNLGSQPDPFAVGPRQVYLRLFVDKTGKVVRGGIVRSGSEPMRDALILKAMASRAYATANLRIAGADGLWQVDLVIDYGTNEYLP